jgi:hypothetical protein
MMQYVRRRIQRVSGVTIRDERIESRDFSGQSLRKGREGDNWDELATERRAPVRDVPVYRQQGLGHRERN